MTVNFKPELLPIFTYPVSSWAKHIRFVLVSLRLNPIEENVSKKVLPYVFSKMPVKLLSILPTACDLDTVLKFLETYDVDSSTPVAILSGNAPLTDRPSIAFQQMQQRLRASLSEGTSDETIKELVWGTIHRQLPDALQTTIHVIPIVGAPNSAQFKMIDDAWATTNSIDFSTRVVAASKSSNTDLLLQQLLDRVSKLELSVTASCSHQNSPTTNKYPPFQPHRQIANNNYRPNYLDKNKTYTHPQNTQKNDTFQKQSTNSTNLCWYHEKYGNKAVKCILPCDYAHLNH